MYIYSIYQELAEMVDCGSVIRKAKKNHKKNYTQRNIKHVSVKKKFFFSEVY